MFVMVKNREVGGHVEYMEVHKIHVKNSVSKLPGRIPLNRGLDILRDGNTAGPLHTMRI
jgi:hypothetical protein